ncbi:MAG: BLUF domain-containing protein, partial [Naasia sp.]
HSVPAATLSVAYSSRATEDFSDSDLVELLTLSRRNNIRLGLTGVLLYRGGRFLQYLEGPEQAVAERIEIIAADTRHDDFQIRFRGSVGGRLFPSWSMGFERVTDEMVDDIPGYRASFVDASRDRDDRQAQGAMSDVASWFAARPSRTGATEKDLPDA